MSNATKFVALLMCHQNNIFQSIQVEETKSEPYLVLLALLGAIIHFIPIWTNLNETLWHYSCSIENTYFNH